MPSQERKDRIEGRARQLTVDGARECTKCLFMIHSTTPGIKQVDTVGVARADMFFLDDPTKKKDR